MSNTQTPLREEVVYKSLSEQGAAAKFHRDLKRRQKQGWKLVICTETGKSWLLYPILTAIYEK